MAQYESEVRIPKQELITVISVSLDLAVTKPHSALDDCLKSWLRQKEKLMQGEITKEQYDEWRYKYPAFETLQKKHITHKQKSR